MPVRKSSHVRLEQQAAENVGGELLLSLGVLESLLPIRGGQLEDAVAGPARQEAQEVAHVGEGLDLVQPGAREERDEDGVHPSSVFATDEHPIFPAEHLPAQIQLADVVAQGQTPIIEESAQGDALVERVPDAGGDRRFVENELGLGFAPHEELVDDAFRLGETDGLLFFRA